MVVSFFGDWFKTIALYAIVQEMTGSAQAVAAVMVGKLLPVFLVTPIAGPLVDRVDRRLVMLGADFARAVTVLGIIVAHQMGSLYGVFGALIVTVCFSGLFIPARTASIPSVTAPNELPVALAMSAGTWSVTLAFGAAAGGLVTQVVGPDTALALDSLTFLVSAAFLWSLPPLLPRERDADDKATFTDGLVYLRERPYLSTVISLKTAIGFAGGAVVTIPLYGNGHFPLTAGPLFMGLLYAFRGTGALVGSMVLRRFTGDRPDTMRGLIAPGFVLTALSYMALGAFASDVWLAGFCFFSAAVGTGLVWVFASTLGQIASDSDYRGRVFSLEFAGMMLSMSFASWLAGALIDYTSLQTPDVAFWSGAAMLAPALLWTVAMQVLKPTGDGRLKRD